MKSFIDLINEANYEINSISPDQLNTKLNDKNLVLVDVQSKDTVQEKGMIEGAIHANRGFLEFYADQRQENPFKKSELDPEKELIIYCGGGGQGALATKTLKDMGFKSVFNLEGGANAWVSSGYKLVK